METILLDILLFLGVIWLLLGIAYLWKICLRPVPKSVDETTGKPIVTKEQVEHARHVLVAGVNPLLPRLSPKLPLFPRLKIQPIIPVPLRRKMYARKMKQSQLLHLNPHPNIRMKRKRTMKCRLTTRWTSRTKTLSSVKNCRLQTILCPKYHRPASSQGTLSVSTVGTGMTMHSMRKAKRRFTKRCKRYEGLSSWNT